MARGLSNLGRSADGMHQVYLNASVPVGGDLCTLFTVHQCLHAGRWC